MKLFKSSIFAFAATVALAVAATSCSDSEEYPMGPQSDGAYFSGNPTSIELAQGATSFDLTLGRTDVSKDGTVALAFTDPSGLFKAPASASFEGNAETTSIAITYDPAKLEYEKEYKLSLKVEPGTAYGASVYDFSVVLHEPWETMGKCTYTDNIITSLFSGMENFSWQVEIQKNLLVPGMYRLIKPYAGWPGIKEYGFEFDAKAAENMVIDATNPDRVWFGWFNTGVFDEDYGYFEAISRGRWHVTEGGVDEDKVANAGWFGTLVDGIIEFPVDGLICNMTLYNGGPYLVNSDGATTILFPGVVLADYSVNVAYTGRYVDLNDVNYAMASVDCGKDVQNIRVACVATDDVKAALSGLLNGTVDYKQLKGSASTQKVELPLSESGVHTLVAVSYADGQPQELSYQRVMINLGPVAEDDFEDYGMAQITDGFIVSWAEGANPADLVWNAPLQRHKDNPSIFRIVDMYGGECPFAQTILPGHYNIQFDCSDPDCVVVPSQSTGNNVFGDGVITIATLSGAYLEAGASMSQIKTILSDFSYKNGKGEVVECGDINGKLADGVITIPGTNCLATFGEDGPYYGFKGKDCEIILIPDEDAANVKGMRKVTNGDIRNAAHYDLARNHVALRSAKKARILQLHNKANRAL